MRKGLSHLVAILVNHLLLQLIFIDAEQHEVALAMKETVGDANHLGRRRAVNKALPIERRRPILSLFLGLYPRAIGCDMQQKSHRFLHPGNGMKTVPIRRRIRPARLLPSVSERTPVKTHGSFMIEAGCIVRL